MWGSNLDVPLGHVYQSIVNKIVLALILCATFESAECLPIFWKRPLLYCTGHYKCELLYFPMLTNLKSKIIFFLNRLT
jgi:hypothetical protein